MDSPSKKTPSPQDLHLPLPDAEEEATDELVVHMSPPNEGDAADALTVNDLAQPLAAAGNYLAGVEHLLEKDDAISRAETAIGIHQTRKSLKKAGELLRIAVAEAEETRDLNS